MRWQKHVAQIMKTQGNMPLGENPGVGGTIILNTILKKSRSEGGGADSLGS